MVSNGWQFMKGNLQKTKHYIEINATIKTDFKR